MHCVHMLHEERWLPGCSISRRVNCPFHALLREQRLERDESLQPSFWRRYLGGRCNE